tara:strand:+ start:546 stop:692 length:147 start_codon:yes stop_codon:yes gene_type:complete
MSEDVKEDNLENENENDRDYESELSNFLKDYLLVLEENNIIKGGKNYE